MEVIIALGSAICGFAIKTLWQSYVDKQKEIEFQTWRMRTGELENQLSKFYWPIYLRLQKDNVIWEKILERNNAQDESLRKLAHQIELDVLLPNHAEILKILELNIHLAKPDPEFETKILKYIRHVDVYRALRSAGVFDRDPLSFGEPYPDGFFNDVESRLKQLQSEYDEVLNYGKVLLAKPNRN